MLRAPRAAAVPYCCSIAFLLLLTAGCNYDPPTAPPDANPVYDTLHVLVDDGQGGTYPGIDVFLVGRTGYGRHVYLDTLAGVTIPLDGNGLAAPRLVQSGTGTFGVLNTVFANSGRVNVTPLTELVAGGVLGWDPGYSIGLVIDALERPYLDVITPERVALAQTEAADLLLRGIGLTVLPAGVDWATYPFAPVAGDPMHESIAAIANLGFDFEGGRQLMIRNGALCSAGTIIAHDGTAARRFCAADRRTSTDAGDPSVTLYEMVNVFGDSLVVQARAGAAIGVSYLRSDPERFGCEGAACRGVTIGAVASDGSIPIAFNATTLARAGGGGQTTLNGSTTAQSPGGPGGVLVCTLGKGPVVMRMSDGTIRQSCVFGQDGGPAFRGRSFFFWQADSGYEARAYFIGESVYAINMTNVPDPAEGSPVTFQCIAAACAGVTIVPDTVDRRKLSLNGTTLVGYRLDGSATGTTITVTGELRNYPPRAPESVVSDRNCHSLPGTDSVAFKASDQPLWHICVAPFDSVLNQQPYKYAYNPGDGSLIFILGGGGLPGTSTGFITLFTRDGVVESAFSGVLYDNWQCLGQECTGISISAPDDKNQVSVTFDQVLMQEVFGIGRGSPPTILDRHTVLDGTIRGVQVLQ